MLISLDRAHLTLEMTTVSALMRHLRLLFPCSLESSLRMLFTSLLRQVKPRDPSAAESSRQVFQPFPNLRRMLRTETVLHPSPLPEISLSSVWLVPPTLWQVQIQLLIQLLQRLSVRQQTDLRRLPILIWKYTILSRST